MKLLPVVLTTVILTGFALPLAPVAYGDAASNKTLTTTQIAALTLPAVVSITVRDKTGEPVKSGSGFVIAPGWIATNQHVVMGAHEVTVNFSDGRSVSSPGFVVEKTRYDLAIISCDTGTVTPLVLADSSSVKIGESVVAVGSPEGLNGSISSGIVSGIRTLPERGNAKVFQTTAPISHGSSGGPLLNAQGQVIGMNSFYFAGGQNLNFAYASGYIDDALPHLSTNDITRLKQFATKLGGLLIQDGAKTCWDDVPLLCDLFGEKRMKPATTDDIEACLDKGADLNAKNNDGHTALMIAALECHTDCVNALVAAGADVNLKANDGQTALMTAAASGQADSLKALISAGADLNLKDNGGFTPLIMAAYYGHTDCVNALVAAGADLNLKANGGFTALMVAAMLSKADCVNALVAAGADVNARDNNGHTALMEAVGGPNCPPNVAKILIAAGAEVDARDKKGMTALMSAARWGSAVSVKALIAAGADINAQDNIGAPVRLYARLSTNTENYDIIVAALKTAGASE
ncbi:MAG: ankyrin repeat domain-containing protein [Capsulimonadaceae bacterium]|nr:ankyrin repeat domain-containing protein [Capsulimonadaceae bacterium]